MKKCSECTLQNPKASQSGKCKSCTKCEAFLCLSHMRMHHERRVEFRTEGLSVSCFSGPSEVVIKGAPRSFSNEGAMCSYSSLLQCLAVCISSKNIGKIVEELHNSSGENVLQTKECRHRLPYQHHKTSMPVHEYVHTRLCAVLMSILTLQIADKMAFDLPDVLMQHILQSTVDGNEALDEGKVHLSGPMGHVMRDVASLFCSFLFFDCPNLVEKAPAYLHLSIDRLRNLFRSSFFGSESCILSFPPSVWLSKLKAHCGTLKSCFDRHGFLLSLIESMRYQKKTDEEIQARTEPSGLEWPQTLVLHFDRCSTITTANKTSKRKINTHIPLPFVFYPFQFSDAFAVNRENVSYESHHLYSLQGIVVHDGPNADEGHFTSFVRRSGKWFHCNDASYVLCSEDAVDDANVYMAFYSMIE